MGSAFVFPESGFRREISEMYEKDLTMNHKYDINKAKIIKNYV